MPKRKAPSPRSSARSRSAALPRPGGTRLQIANSGLEVWLYDDSHLARLRSAGLLRPAGERVPGTFGKLAKQGMFVGYSLCQDDEVDLAVYVGSPLTPEELSPGRWLEPQTALLRLPSGELRVESNDACRFGPDQPGAEGAAMRVPPGNYRLTLYRIDHEALDRAGLIWRGPQEVVVLTPGGKPGEAAGDLLPFQQHRDKSWIGQYAIKGNRAEARVWFPDGWDTYVVNLDSAAVKRLALMPGAYLRTDVPAAGLSLISCYAGTWDEARRMPPPAGDVPEEYGYAALSPMADWDQAEALFCRRDRTKKGVEDKHLNHWLPATLEVLALKPASTLTTTELTPVNLETRDNWFDPGFFSMVLPEVLPEVEDKDELTIAGTLKLLEKRLAKLGLTAQGDFVAPVALRGQAVGPVDLACRLYAGLPNGFFAVMATKGTFELLFLTELADQTWIATGLADDLERLVRAAGRPGVQIAAVDELFPRIYTAHKASLAKKSLAPPPGNVAETSAAFLRFLKAAFG